MPFCSMRTDHERFQDVEDAVLMALRIPESELMLVTGERARAAQKLIEIVGEALKHVSPAFRSDLRNVDYSGPARMRDRLAHRYFEIDGQEVCRVVRVDLPRLLAQLRLARLVGTLPPRP